MAVLWLISMLPSALSASFTSGMFQQPGFLLNAPRASCSGKCVKGQAGSKESQRARDKLAGSEVDWWSEAALGR